MAFTSVKALVLIQLSVLVLGSFSKLSYGEVIERWPLDDHQANDEIISTEGHLGFGLFKPRHSPGRGASVKLVCRNSERNANVQWALTDKNGDFAIITKSLTRADVHKCKVYLVKSPKPICNVPTNFNNGKSGDVFKPVLPPKPPGNPGPGPVQPPMFDFFGVGPFIFEAPNEFPCEK
ncbi:hypothetical protein K7X08_018100 [Anisodus acutangulus]|uniref:Uncharacterized protein n=1 Tax=Anisodus acutangulus TaxID=402998 RepID=A0A9Q1LVE1_9SOLA|nr:hypothetical protein K7X08_018100 [Anisodus acutangulus]